MVFSLQLFIRFPEHSLYLARGVVCVSNYQEHSAASCPVAPALTRQPPLAHLGVNLEISLLFRRY